MKMNNFNNDGSFLERFKSLQRKEAPLSSVSSIPEKRIKTEPNDDASNSRCNEMTTERKESSKSSPFTNDGGFLSRFKQLKRLSTTANDANRQISSPSTSKHEDNARMSNFSASPFPQSVAIKKPLIFDDTDDEAVDLKLDPKTRDVILQLANEVQQRGVSAEEDAISKYRNDPAYWFLHDSESEAYKFYQRLIRFPVKMEPTETTASSDTATPSTSTQRKRKSRWDTDDTGKKAAAASVAPVGLALPTGALLNSSTGGDDEFDSTLVGSSQDETRKQMLEQVQLKLIQERILAKRAAMKTREQAVLMGKAKPIFEYDSDEEADDGTWEHKLRKMEMEKTKNEAEKRTEEAQGKHHIGQFLPPEELDKFMTSYQAMKDGKTVDKSDFQEAKLTEENKGFKLLQKMGWKEGSGLGATEQGITAPVNRGRAVADNEGLGASSSNDVSNEDDIFDVYRKRMMLAYRFRPNPLNNPRRPYY